MNYSDQAFQSLTGAMDEAADKYVKQLNSEAHRQRCWIGLAAVLNTRRTDLEAKLQKQQQETAKGLAECESLEKLYQAIQTLPPDIQDAFLITVCTGE